MNERIYHVNAILAPCPECKRALIIIEGKPAGLTTFWTKAGTPMMTPHIESCSMNGKELSDE